MTAAYSRIGHYSVQNSSVSGKIFLVEAICVDHVRLGVKRRPRYNSTLDSPPPSVDFSRHHQSLVTQ